MKQMVVSKCNLQNFAVFAIGARFYHRAVKVISNSVQVIVVCMVPWASSPPFVDACADAAQTAQTSGSNAGNTPKSMGFEKWETHRTRGGEFEDDWKHPNFTGKHIDFDGFWMLCGFS